MNQLGHIMHHNSKKRLCVLMQGHWSRVMGGSQYQAKCIIEELNKTGKYDIVFLTRDHRPDYRPKGYRLVQYGYPGAHKRGFHRIPFEMVTLPRALRKIDPDIIYQRVGCAQTGISAHYARKNNCKMVWHIAHDSDLERHQLKLSRFIIYRWLERKLLNYGIKHATQIIAQTEDQKAMLEKNFKRSPTEVIPNFHPLPTETVEKRYPVKVAWVANLKIMKQPEIFIRLADEMKNAANVQFLMIGEMQGSKPAKQRYAKMIENVQNLRYLGGQSQEVVNATLAESHIFVNTSLQEGFPNTFIQAWLRKVPVVSLHVDPDKLIERYKIGFVAGSIEKLREKVSMLVSDDELREHMGNNAKTFANRHFSPNNAIRIYKLLEG